MIYEQILASEQAGDITTDTTETTTAIEMDYNSIQDPEALPLILWSDLIDYDDDKQREYLSAMRRLWQAGGESIAAVLRTTKTRVYNNMARLGFAPYTGPKQTRALRARYMRWAGLDAIGRTQLHQDAQEPQAAAQITTDDSQTLTDTTTGQITIHGTLGDVAAIMQALATRDPLQHDISVSWS